MSSKDRRIDAYISKAAPFAKPILNHIRWLVHKACPAAEETMKWSFPHFDYKGEMMCSMASFKAHCAFGFWKASLMKDYAKKLQPVGETAMGHFGRITSLKDLPPDKIIIAYIKEACRLNDAGKKIAAKPKTERRDVKTPAYFLKYLGKNKKAIEAYKKFSPSHQREYVEWITEAKTEETREKRMKTALEWISEGKSRNWKYIRK